MVGPPSPTHTTLTFRAIGKGVPGDYWNSDSKKDAMYVLKEPHQHNFIDISLLYLDMKHREEKQKLKEILWGKVGLSMSCKNGNWVGKKYNISSVRYNQW